MPFRPNPGDALDMDGVLYSIAEHPFARNMPYGQEGRAATVYQLLAGQEKRALKVFKTRFQVPSLVILAERLAGFAGLPGLRVCRRSVITARRHIQLVRDHPDLNYAVVMPWIEGPTWMEVLLNKEDFSPEQSLTVARGLVEVLAGMEERGLAHCDMSGPNLLLPVLVSEDESFQSSRQSPQSAIELVDVEQMFGEDLKRPEIVPGGSAGYAHKTAPEGLWSSVADRFAGALLISEMLGWCDSRVRDAAWGESYFDPQEMQKESERYKVLAEALRDRWGGRVAGLLEQAWESDTLADCPTFGRWLAELPDAANAVEAAAASINSARVGAVANREVAVSTPNIEVNTTDADGGPQGQVQDILARAQTLESEGDSQGAVEAYRQALAAVPPESGLASELPMIIEHLESSTRTEPQSPMETAETTSQAEHAPFEAVEAAQYQIEPDPQSIAQVAPIETSVQAEPQPEPVQAQTQPYQPRSYPPPAAQPPPQQPTSPTQPQVYQPPSYSAPTPQPSAYQYQNVSGPAPAGPGATQVVRTRKGGSGRVIVPIVLVALLLVFAGVAFLALRSQGVPKGEGTSVAALVGTDTPTVFEEPPTKAPTDTAVSVDIKGDTATQVVSPVEVTPTAQSGQADLELPGASERHFKYADLLFNVASAVITTRDKDGNPLDPGKAKLNLKLSVENPTESTIAINTALLKLTLGDGTVYKEPTYLPVYARDTAEVNLSFDVPATTKWDGAKFSLDEIGKIPVAVPLDGPTPAPEYPVTLPLSGEANLKTPDATYTLTGGTVDLDAFGKRADIGKRYLILKVTVTTKAESGINISTTNFRLIVDGKTLGADNMSPSSDSLYVLQEKQFTVAFLVPETATKGELEVGELGKEAARIHLDSGQVSATPTAAEGNVGSTTPTP